MTPETASSPASPENAEWAARNLQDQVRHLEDALLAQQDALQECRQRLAIFEAAAGERLRVILEGDELLKTSAQAILTLQAEAGELRLQIQELETSAASHTEERQRLERACREATRGVEELANRERALTREILELRNERLVHSILRRLNSLFS